MRFRDTLRPLVIASAAAAVVQILFVVVAQRMRPLGLSLVIAGVWVWILTLAAAVIFVMPILAFVPSLRRPSLWLAAIWGALAAGGFAPLLRREGGTGYSFEMWAWITVVGSAAGLVYATIARRQNR